MNHSGNRFISRRMKARSNSGKTSGWLANWIFINDSSASAYSTLALSWFRASRYVVVPRSDSSRKPCSRSCAMISGTDTPAPFSKPATLTKAGTFSRSGGASMAISVLPGNVVLPGSTSRR
ncbi:hypothetical protein D3C72_1980130 [compost metagenome]